MFSEWENSSGKLQIISGKFQNNAINDVKQISLSHVIKWLNFLISEPTLYSWLNVNSSLLETGAISEGEVTCNGTRTHNHLVRKRTLNYLAKLA